MVSKFARSKIKTRPLRQARSPHPQRRSKDGNNSK
jgi:hypothetical protein